MVINNILVVKLSAIGDVIHALPVSYALKETFPQAKVSLVVEPPAYDLLTNNPYIDEIILFEKKKFKSFGGLIKNLPSFSSLIKQKKYQQYVQINNKDILFINLDMILQKSWKKEFQNWKD